MGHFLKTIYFLIEIWMFYEEKKKEYFGDFNKKLLKQILFSLIVTSNFGGIKRQAYAKLSNKEIFIRNFLGLI